MLTLILSEMLVRSSVCAWIASLISGLLCCSEHGAAQYVKSARHDGLPSRRSDPVSEFFYRSAYRRPSSAPTPYNQDADGYQNERFNSNIEAAEENFDYYNEEQQEDEAAERSSFERAENEPSSMQTSASHAQPVKSERSTSRFSGSSYKSGHSGSSYSVTLQPGAIAVTCKVKDPLEHIVWLRSLCPDEYDRGDVIAKGSVSSFPDVFGVSVSGEDGEFTSTLTISKPRTQMGSGVFRCEAWPHHGSDHHRRHRRQASGREGRGHHNPWNGIILGGHEMVDECFFNHYGEKWRQYRAMDSHARTTGNEIPAEAKPSSNYQQPTEEINETAASYLGANLFPEYAPQETDYDAMLKMLQEGGASELVDLTAADVSHVPQIDNRDQRHTYPQQFQRPYPVFVPSTPNMARQQQEQPVMHYQSRRVNLQSGGQDVRADIEMSTDLQVHPHRESTPNRVAFSRMIQVEGTPQE